MNYKILISILCLLSLKCYSQHSSYSETEFEQIFLIKKVKYGERESLQNTINTIPEKHRLSGMVNNNKSYLEYLIKNFSDNKNYSQLLALENTEELQEKYIGALKKDSLFNAAMFKISEKALNPSFVADTVSIDELLNVAVKFFNIKGITKEGHYAGKVCSGINGIVETLPERKPHLEAFSFSTIIENIEHQEENMHDEFVIAMYELYKLDLGVEKEDRLLRAQGVMFSLMRNNAKLKKLLLSEYEKKKEYLPFVVST